MDAARAEGRDGYAGGGEEELCEGPFCWSREASSCLLVGFEVIVMLFLGLRFHGFGGGLVAGGGMKSGVKVLAVQYRGWNEVKSNGILQLCVFDCRIETYEHPFRDGRI